MKWHFLYQFNFCFVSSLLLAGCQYDNEQAKLAHSPEIHYECENNRSITVHYISTDKLHPRAMVRFENKNYKLPLTPSGSGARYSDGKYTWWNKGKSGFFQVDGAIAVNHCNSR